MRVRDDELRKVVAQRFFASDGGIPLEIRLAADLLDAREALRQIASGSILWCEGCADGGKHESDCPISIARRALGMEET